MDAPRVQACPFKGRESLDAFSQNQFCSKLSVLLMHFKTDTISFQKIVTSRACRSRGTVVWNYLWPTGGCDVMGACLSSYCRGCVMSEKRGRRLCGSPSRLPECQQRKGTSLRHAETGSCATLREFPAACYVHRSLEVGSDVSQTTHKIIFILDIPLLRWWGTEDKVQKPALQVSQNSHSPLKINHLCYT